MSWYLIAIELILGVIVATSGLIAYEFYRSVDGKLRVLIIQLFITKIFVYGGAAAFFLIYPPDSLALIRAVVLNLPMFWVMVKLWKYIRTHNS